MVALDEPFRGRLLSNFSSGFEEGGFAELGGALGLRAEEEGNAAVPEHGEMLDTLANAFLIFDGDGAHFFLGGRGVNEDHGNVAEGEFVEEGTFDAEGHDGNAFDIALDHAADAGL